MLIHHLNCGTLCPSSARFVLGRGGWLERARLVCHCLLVETRAGLALVDTGLGSADVADPERRLGKGFLARNRPPLDPAETAIAQLRALGLEARDVRHVLPTHLDLDHAGGLSDFPDADVHVFAAELDAALSPEGQRARTFGYRPAQWSHAVRWKRHAPSGGERWMGFEAVRPLAGTDDEVLVVPLVGHSPGHAGIAVRGEAGWVLHAGDAYFDVDEIDPVRPTRGWGLALFQHLRSWDDTARRANQERLRTLARDHAGTVEVISAHCALELARHPMLTPVSQLGPSVAR